MRSIGQFLSLGLLLAGAAPLHAQHGLAGGGTYDPRVPTPQAVLGYPLGERFTPHHMLMRYLERLAASSARVRLDTVAHTFEGRELMRVVLTSEANRQRLDAIRRDAQTLFDPRRTDAAELRALVARAPSVAWLGYSVHGGEASGVEAAIGVLYQLAAGTDAETRLVLDSLVVLIDPVQNPDGHERHVQDVMRMRSAFGVPTLPAALIHTGTWPGPRTSHYYFDLNRDWFIHSHPETVGRVRTFMEWAPHVAVDLHEMGSNSTYFFAPPMEPINANVPQSVRDWWDIYAAANAEAMARHGWSFFRREGYDEFYPGYGVSWPVLNGAIGMTYEQASSAGGAIRRIDGTVITLRDAVMHHYTTSMATLLTTARRRHERVRDYLAFRQSAVSEHLRGPMRAIVFARDEDGRADSLAQRLIANGIAVHRRRGAAALRGATAFAGNSRGARVASDAYVVDLAQPQGRMAKALLEPEAQLDSLFITEELASRETSQPNRFYDITAWSLPYLFRLHAWTVSALPDGLEAVDAVRAAPGVAPPPRATYGYAFAAGSEASLRMLAALLADSVRVSYARRSFRVGERGFPKGAFLVRVTSNGESVHEVVRRHAAATGAQVTALGSAMVDEGTDLGSNSVIPLRRPRVALVGGPGVSGNSFGFAWYAFDQRLRYPVATVSAAALTNALDDVDVVVIPSVQAPVIDRELGDSGRQRLGEWLRAGGVLITLDGGTSWLANERLGLSRLRLRSDTARADSARADAPAGAPLPAIVPGAIVRVQADTLSPLLAGIGAESFGVLVFSDRVLRAPRDFRPGEIVLRYAPAAQLRIAGYLWPEVPARLAGTPYLWTERVGRGRVIAFAGD
ncbi:MAG TPA: M14 family zinc carboxypeptidase, partial [Longimicrobiales bacterium]